MEVLGLVVGIIGVAAGAVAWARWAAGNKAMAAERAELEAKISQLDGRRRKAEKRLEDLTDRAKRLERELHIAVERREEKATARAMWDLELARAERRWREVVVPAQAAGPDARSSGERLTYAVEQDVARLREEVGVSIRFEGAVDCELDPESAVGSLRITEEVLAFATRSADEIVVKLDQEQSEDGEMLVSLDVECSGWDDSTEGESDGWLDSITTMAQRLGGWARHEDGADTVVVSARIPAGRQPVVATDDSDRITPVGG